jgi:hypothetical protein
VKKEVTDSNNSVAKDTKCHSNFFIYSANTTTKRSDLITNI